MRKRGCDLGGVEFLEVQGRKVGIVGLGRILQEVAALGLSDEHQIAIELLGCVQKENHVPPEELPSYCEALLYVYRTSPTPNRKGSPLEGP